MIMRVGFVDILSRDITAGIVSVIYKKKSH